MKPSKTRWPIVAVGILIAIVLGSLGTVYAQQVREGNQLNVTLSLAAQRVNKPQLEQLRFEQQELDKQLAQTLFQLETAKTQLSQPIESIAATEALFNIVRACGVKMTEMTSSTLGTGDLAEVTCSVLPLTVRVEGNVSSLLTFIIALNSDLTNGVVKSAELSIPMTSSEEKASANIKLAIYTYQGD